METLIGVDLLLCTCAWLCVRVVHVRTSVCVRVTARLCAHFEKLAANWFDVVAVEVFGLAKIVVTVMVMFFINSAFWIHCQSVAKNAI